MVKIHFEPNVHTFGLKFSEPPKFTSTSPNVPPETNPVKVHFSACYPVRVQYVGLLLLLVTDPIILL